MSKRAKRPRLQTTTASDITPRHNFTHSSNTSTRTRQIVTSATLEPPGPEESDISPMNSDFFMPASFVSEDFPAPVEHDPPAGMEVVRKPHRYANSVRKELAFWIEIFS